MRMSDSILARENEKTEKTATEPERGKRELELGMEATKGSVCHSRFVLVAR